MILTATPLRCGRSKWKTCARWSVCFDWESVTTTLGNMTKLGSSSTQFLEIDRANTAARTLLEKTDRTMMNHLRTARDQMRSDLIRKVDELWQVPVPNVNLQPKDSGGELGGGVDGSQLIRAKLRRIVIPSIQFNEATLEEAIAFLRIKTRQLDDLEPDPERKGVSFILRGTESAPKITLSLTNVPADQALKAMTDLAGCTYRLEPFAAVVVPLTDAASEIVTRTFDIAPDFLSLGGAIDVSDISDDPFAEDTESSRVAQRATATDVLAAAGIKFPDGASAFYNPSTGKLVVRNTRSQLDLVSAFTGSTTASASSSSGEATTGEPRAYFAQQPDTVPTLYQKLETTEELAENQYYKVPLAQRAPELIKANRFWRDYAAWNGEGLFLSPHFGDAASSLNEALLALALLDLPFEQQEPETVLEGDRFTTTATTPLIVFHREIGVAEIASDPSPLLVSQKFYRNDERYVYEGPVKRTKYVTERFLAHVVYTQEIVLTNTGEARETVNLLAQIPAGGGTVNESKELLARRLMLEPFKTERLELQFYFPQPGTFPVYPATVAQDGKVIARANAFTCTVVERPVDVDAGSWQNVAQFGSDEQVLTYLRNKSLQRLPLDRMAWRIKRSRDFFKSAVAALNDRGAFDRTLFSYGLHHRDVEAAAIFLLHENAFIDQCGGYLKSRLLTIDPVQRGTFEHLEYDPLVNARAHRLGNRWTISNDRFYQYYLKQLNFLCSKATLNDADRLRVAYYLFLQDRVEEALAQYDRIDPANLPNRLQFDYLRCVVAFYREQPEIAHAIAEPYASHAVKRWRERFTEVIRQTDEISGANGDTDTDDAKRRDIRQDRLAASSPSLELSVDGVTPKLKYRNIPEVTVNYFGMDLEVLFSSNPFMEYDARRFGLVPPAHTEVVTLLPDKPQIALALPEGLKGKNVLVEVTGGGERQTCVVFASTFKVDIAETYGRLQVRSDSR